MTTILLIAMPEGVIVGVSALNAQRIVKLAERINHNA